MSDQVFLMSLASLVTSTLNCGIKIRKIYELKALWAEESRLIADLKDLKDLEESEGQKKWTSLLSLMRESKELSSKEPVPHQRKIPSEPLGAAKPVDTDPLDNDRPITNPGSLVVAQINVYNE